MRLNRPEFDEKQRRRRVLLSCYACSPHWGSEPGVGWRWLVELSKRHDVLVITHGYFRAHLEPLLREAPLTGVTVHYFAPAHFGVHPHKQLNSRLFYIWWQWRVRSFVKNLLLTEPIDLIHHLTWGTVRFPTFLGNLGVPLVMGPLGGGEVAPIRLLNGLPWREWVSESIRHITLWWSKIDPLALLGPKRSVLVLCRTVETMKVFPRSVRARSTVAPEIGAPPVDLTGRREGHLAGSPFKLLFAGRLLGWKGVGFAINATSLLRKSGYDVTLDIAGDGPLRPQILSHIEKEGLENHVRLMGKLPREELLDLYSQADLFVFPSLHDAGGSVVLEALSRGLPVICLDLGGPKYFLTAECGVVVSTHNRSRQDVETAIAGAIALIFDKPELLKAMTRAAAKQAAVQTWEVRVLDAYALIERRLNWLHSNEQH